MRQGPSALCEDEDIERYHNLANSEKNAKPYPTHHLFSVLKIYGRWCPTPTMQKSLAFGSPRSTLPHNTPVFVHTNEIQSRKSSFFSSFTQPRLRWVWTICHKAPYDRTCSICETDTNFSEGYQVCRQTCHIRVYHKLSIWRLELSTKLLDALCTTSSCWHNCNTLSYN